MEGGATQGGTEAAAALIVFVRLPELGLVKTRLAASVGLPLALDFYKACCAYVIPRLVLFAKARGASCFIAYSGGHQGFQNRGGQSNSNQRPLDDELANERQEARKSEAEEVQEGEAAVELWLAEMGLEEGGAALFPQEDTGDLGERMRRALLHVQAQGFSKLVLVVFGPAADGGYYSIGLHYTPIPITLFQGIPWSTGEVLSRSLAAAAAAGISVAPCHTLPTLKDIDDFHDLKSWYANATPPKEAPLSKEFPAVEAKAGTPGVRQGESLDAESHRGGTPAARADVSGNDDALERSRSEDPAERFRRFFQVVKGIVDDRACLEEELAATGYTL